jgi:hypothetical protein
MSGRSPVNRKASGASRLALFFMRSRWAAVTVLAALAALAACENPFGLRDPEPPETGRSTWIPPLVPEQVFANLAGAVRERNDEHFARCLSDPAFSPRPYRFVPDPETAAVHPEVFADWGRERERSVMDQAFALVPADSACALAWTDTVRTFTSADTAVFVLGYRLDLGLQREPPPRRCEGQAEFRLCVDGRGEWAVYRWIDNGGGGAPSWSVLKVSFGG